MQALIRALTWLTACRHPHTGWVNTCREHGRLCQVCTDCGAHVAAKVDLAWASERRYPKAEPAERRLTALEKLALTAELERMR